MSGEYRRIPTARLWTDARMRALRRRSRDAHDLLKYLIDSPSGNFIGLYCLPEAYAVEDLIWTRRRYRKALALLVEENMIGYDETAAIVYVPFVLEWDPVSAKGQAEGAVRKLQSLPKTGLVGRLKADLLSHGLVQQGERVRPLLEYLGLIPVRGESDTRLTATPSPSSSTSTATALAPRATERIFIQPNGDATIPRTRSEVMFEDQILPLLGEPHRRDEWLRALRAPGAIEDAEAAAAAYSAARSRDEIRNPGAFVWAKFRELQQQRAQGVNRNE